jgi:hypothetical protein
MYTCEHGTSVAISSEFGTHMPIYIYKNIILCVICNLYIYI